MHQIQPPVKLKKQRRTRDYNAGCHKLLFSHSFYFRFGCNGTSRFGRNLDILWHHWLNLAVYGTLSGQNLSIEDVEIVGLKSQDNDLAPGNHISHQKRLGSSLLALSLRRLLLCSILLISFTNYLYFSNFWMLIHCSGLPSLWLQLSRTLNLLVFYLGETDSECWTPRVQEG